MTFKRKASGRFVPAATLFAVMFTGAVTGLMLIHLPQMLFGAAHSPEILATVPVVSGNPAFRAQAHENRAQTYKFIGEFKGSLHEGAMDSTGQTLAGVSLDPVVTNIWLCADGRLRGSYEVRGSSSYNFRGQLEQLGDLKDGRVVFQWTDQYGSGCLNLGADSKGSHGNWTTYGIASGPDHNSDPNYHSWNGVRAINSSN